MEVGKCDSDVSEGVHVFCIDHEEEPDAESHASYQAANAESHASCGSAAEIVRDSEHVAGQAHGAAVMAGCENAGQGDAGQEGQVQAEDDAMTGIEEHDHEEGWTWEPALGKGHTRQDGETGEAVETVLDGSSRPLVRWGAEADCATDTEVSGVRETTTSQDVARVLSAQHSTGTLSGDQLGVALTQLDQSDSAQVLGLEQDRSRVSLESETPSSGEADQQSLLLEQATPIARDGSEGRSDSLLSETPSSGEAGRVGDGDKDEDLTLQQASPRIQNLLPEPGCPTTRGLSLSLEQSSPRARRSQTLRTDGHDVNDEDQALGARGMQGSEPPGASMLPISVQPSVSPSPKSLGQSLAWRAAVCDPSGGLFTCGELCVRTMWGFWGAPDADPSMHVQAMTRLAGPVSGKLVCCWLHVAAVSLGRPETDTGRASASDMIRA